MRASTAESFELVRNTAPERARVRELVKEGKWLEAEPDHARVERFMQRRVANDADGAEAIQGMTNDLQSVRFLTRGARARRAVAFVEVNTPALVSTGSGFLVSPRVFLTNAHVIPDRAAAFGASIVFDRELGETGRPSPISMYTLDPDALALFSDADHFDYALVALGVRNAGTGTVDEFGFLPISAADDKHIVGMALNIIQHPDSLPKMIALRNNLLVHRTDHTLLYETDTDHGSSGSPVLNDEWEAVALHHWGQPHIEEFDEHGNLFPKVVNEGVRISSVYADLERRLDDTTLTDAGRALLREVLDATAATDAATPGRVLAPPRPGISPLQHASESNAPATPSQQQGLTMNARSADMADSLRFIIPVELTIRIAGGAAPDSVSADAGTGARAEPSRTLRFGAESVQVDTNYSNRDGYDSAFIDGVDLPLPEIATNKLQSELAPLRATEANADDGELKYEHFSVKVNRARKMAIYTATNIDGARYLSVIRETGLVGTSEGDRWFKDTRISESFVLGQDFYGAWSLYFDRGHLTRRTDPTWGDSNEVAERANADTFHFTNCSPQHFRFNQTAKYWQGLERYVLENGLLQHAPSNSLTVFQGPIFSDAIDRWADDVQIPSSFWKIVVWQGAEGLRAVGLVADQGNLLDQPRVGMARPADLPDVDVNHWRVKISTIQRRTGLDFGAAVRGADTIGDDDQPNVAEAARPIRSFNDILL